MDVLLINPPHILAESNMWKKINRCLPPLGLGYIASFLESRQVSVNILDAAAGGFPEDVKRGQ